MLLILMIITVMSLRVGRYRITLPRKEIRRAVPANDEILRQVQDDKAFRQAQDDNVRNDEINDYE